MVDGLQIGARNMQNFALLTAAGQSGLPVVLKRGFGCTVEETLAAAEYLLLEGNDQVVLCERGIRTFEPSARFTLDLTAVALWKQRTHLPVMVDPSHSGGRPELVEPLSLAAIAVGADALSSMSTSSRSRRCATATRHPPTTVRRLDGPARSYGGRARPPYERRLIDRGARCSLRSCRLAIVGLGPRGLSVAERLCANAESLLPHGRELVIHLIDPHVFDGGQVWRSTQDRVLLMNTVACQVTVFVDDTVDCDGPVVTGPSLYEWARSIALIGSPSVPEAVRAEAVTLGPDDYPSRAFYGSYLQWARDRIIWTAPPAVSFESHQATAVDVRDTPDGLQEVVLNTGETIGDLQAVVLALGHMPHHLGESETALSRVRGPARPAVHRAQQPRRRVAGRHTRGRAGASCAAWA